MSDFSPAWERADKTVTEVAFLLNHLRTRPIQFQTATHEQQDELLAAADRFVHELVSRGVLVFHRDDKEVQKRITEFFISIFQGTDHPTGLN